MTKNLLTFAPDDAIKRQPADDDDDDDVMIMMMMMAKQLEQKKIQPARELCRVEATHLARAIKTK